eukprot:SAG31_NODE_1125_length_9770_cov_2.732499_2_plen_196_part_00
MGAHRNAGGRERGRRGCAGGGKFGTPAETVHTFQYCWPLPVLNHDGTAQGIVDFDSAPMYSNGCSEARLGKAIAAAGAMGTRARVTTKTGRLLRQLGGVEPVPAEETLAKDPELRELVADYSGVGTRLSLRESLGRLGMARCFALRVHDCDGAGGKDCYFLDFVGLFLLNLLYVHHEIDCLLSRFFMGTNRETRD